MAENTESKITRDDMEAFNKGDAAALFTLASQLGEQQNAGGSAQVRLALEVAKALDNGTIVHADPALGKPKAGEKPKPSIYRGLAFAYGQSRPFSSTSDTLDKLAVKLTSIGRACEHCRKLPGNQKFSNVLNAARKAELDAVESGSIPAKRLRRGMELFYAISRAQTGKDKETKKPNYPGQRIPQADWQELLDKGESEAKEVTTETRLAAVVKELDKLLNESNKPGFIATDAAFRADTVSAYKKLKKIADTLASERENADNAEAEREAAEQAERDAEEAARQRAGVEEDVLGDLANKSEDEVLEMLRARRATAEKVAKSARKPRQNGNGENATA